ncbi:hypothetical protein IU479_35600 [Nocardia abscessus]|uniref:hypothetical protein n=1 Tax=Nocardia TaxID=1817 RepID=UPI001893FD67|nr:MULTISPECIES: hypothetical protein [Nocardia]MBF6223395.1 hypothetical protein [Nocardia abscessus]MDE1673925.1 hypothetical protein [Nocardia gipuzkoensis]
MVPKSDSLTASLHTARERLDAVAGKIGTRVLPTRLRTVLRGETGDSVKADAATTERLDEMEHRVLLLGDAVAVLARGLEQLPSSDTDDQRRADAAQQAHRILIAEHLTTASTQQ